MKQRSTVDTRFGGVQTADGYVFELSGGRLCLELANTKDDRLTEHPRELLRDYRDAVDWAVQAGALSPARAKEFRAHAESSPEAAARALTRLRDARETLFQIFSALSHRRPAPAVALDRLHALLQQTIGMRRLHRERNRFVWTWLDRTPPDLDLPLAAAAWSAADVLVSDDLSRVRQCDGTGCAWLFIDTSKNGKRRWCDMSVCGNRAKARRHQARLRGESVA